VAAWVWEWVAAEETEPDHPAGAVEVQGEVLTEAAAVEAEWEATAPEPGPVGTAFAPVVEQRCPIKLDLPATT
jgi:hypothetical protein